MGGNNVRCHIIGGMLHWGKGMNLLSPEEKHDDTAWMLAGGTPHAYASLDNPVDFADSLAFSPALHNNFHIPKGGLFCQSTDGSCTEGLAFSKNNLDPFPW